MLRKVAVPIVVIGGVALVAGWISADDWKSLGFLLLGAVLILAGGGILISEKKN